MTVPKNPPFLLALHLDGKRCVVVGNTEEVVRRVHALRESGARVTLISEHPTNEVRALGDETDVEFVERGFEDADLDGSWLATLADEDDATASRMSRAARERGVFFCAIDQRAHSDYSHVALARIGPMRLAVSTNGKSPTLARRLRDEFERALDEADADAVMEALSKLRERTPKPDRRRVLNEATLGVRVSIDLPLAEEI